MAPRRCVFNCSIVGAIFFSAFCSSSNAEIQIHATRVIYPENAREVNLKVDNTGTAPILLQNWLDDGEVDKKPEEIKVPFQLAPAISRLEPGAAAVLRLVYSKENLPSDRESLYWLNILEIPALQEDDKNRLAFTFRHRIKVFFRPGGLTHNISSAVERLNWKFEPVASSLANARDPAVAVVKVSNPSPYYFSFSKIDVHVADKVVALGTGMVAPFSTVSLTWPQKAEKAPNNAVVRFEMINDFGGLVSLERTLL